VPSPHSLSTLWPAARLGHSPLFLFGRAAKLGHGTPLGTVLRREVFLRCTKGCGSTAPPPRLAEETMAFSARSKGRVIFLGARSVADPFKIAPEAGFATRASPEPQRRPHPGAGGPSGFQQTVGTWTRAAARAATRRTISSAEHAMACPLASTHGVFFCWPGANFFAVPGSVCR
jgi:hypothetical protein